MIINVTDNGLVGCLYSRWGMGGEGILLPRHLYLMKRLIGSRGFGCLHMVKSGLRGLLTVTSGSPPHLRT
jgi:hypothetical protein